MTTVFIDIPLNELYSIPTKYVSREKVGNRWFVECEKDENDIPCLIDIDRYSGEVNDYYDLYGNENDTEHQKIFLQPLRDGPLFNFSPDENLYFAEYIKPQIKFAIMFKQLDESFWDEEEPNDEVLMNMLIHAPVNIDSLNPFSYSIDMDYIDNTWDEDKNTFMSSVPIHVDMLDSIVERLE